MTERIECFARNGKNFVYIDFSDFQTVDEFVSVIEAVEPAIAKYPKSSIYTVTNVENANFDKAIKEALIRYMDFNKPYVKSWAVCGAGDIVKVFINSLSRAAERKNLHYADTKEQAIDWILGQE